MGTKLKILLLLIIIPFFGGYAQTVTFADFPRAMAKDTLNTLTRVTRDIWFNAANTAGYGTLNNGSIDLSIYATIASGSDTLTVEAYGLTAKNIEGTLTTFVGDSTRIGTVIVDGALHIFALESYYTQFPMFDGVRVVLKKGGTDADNDTVWTSARIYK